MNMIYSPDADDGYGWDFRAQGYELFLTPSPSTSTRAQLIRSLRCATDARVSLIMRLNATLANKRIVDEQVADLKALNAETEMRLREALTRNVTLAPATSGSATAIDSISASSPVHSEDDAWRMNNISAVDDDSKEEDDTFVYTKSTPAPPTPSNAEPFVLDATPAPALATSERQGGTAPFVGRLELVDTPSIHTSTSATFDLKLGDHVFVTDKNHPAIVVALLSRDRCKVAWTTGSKHCTVVSRNHVEPMESIPRLRSGRL